MSKKYKKTTEKKFKETVREKPSNLVKVRSVRNTQTPEGIFIPKGKVIRVSKKIAEAMIKDQHPHWVKE